MTMKLQFNSELDYQKEAIDAITGLFEGQLPEESIREYQLAEKKQQTLINGIANNLILTEEQLLKNLNKIQKENDITESAELAGMNFSVEMETGTGKTYVYLRTIYELYQKYDFKKYLIVVPSVAIREGVLKNLEITHEHFQKLYDSVPVHFQVYDSKKVSALRGFATGNTIEILVINIDSFAKDANIINQPNDKLGGQNPIEFIRATNPIVIVDEPQNMETEKRKKAINDLNPLCTLRYSATHRDLYNLTYSLNPVKAYDLGLVKQIEVDSVRDENAYNDAFVSLDAITTTKTRISAKVSINVNTDQGVKKKTISVRAGDDLYDKSEKREIYSSGYIVEEIDASNECIMLSNGNMIFQGQSQGGMNDEIMKYQIEKAVEEHLKKEIRYSARGIKVLTLFFIDRVANYRIYHDKSNTEKGKFATWFEEIYNDYIAKPAYRHLNKFSVDEIHNGYFSQDKKGKPKDTSGETKADDDTYHRIMKDKEKLLDINDPLKFIFSHSALREGWDNPNVFQICTLNETKSEMRKRQEIGRGLRLSVDQTGNRIHDKNINRLTVIANEAYEDFAKTLQKEIEQDCGVEFKDRIKNKKNRESLRYKKGFENDELFIEIWDKIKNKTYYRVNYNTEKLIQSAIEQIKALPEIKSPSIRSTKVSVTMSDEGVDTEYKGDRVKSFDGHIWKIPDILGYIQSKTELTRSTLYEILSKSGRIKDVAKNPQLFLDLVSQAINHTLSDLMIEGIEYHKIGDSYYEMTLPSDQDFMVYLNKYTFKVSNTTKTIYDNFIPLDSNTENTFANNCEKSPDIKYYFKLPAFFKIPTPIGTYNPDWAVLYENDTKLYFVAETKNTNTKEVIESKLRHEEQLKIHCGRKHFEKFDDVEYKVVKTVGQLVG